MDITNSRPADQASPVETPIYDSETCTGSCATCTANCSQAQERTPKHAAVIVAICSGKGGTGKSTVSCLLANEIQLLGHKAAILDADLACPSIHLLYGVTELADSDDKQVFPLTAQNGVSFLSMGNVYDKPESPLLWYGKDQAAGALYFYTDVKWDDPDVLIVDMPSGFGDIPLQLYTTIPFDAALLVGTPDSPCDYTMKKMVNLCKMVYLNNLGIVENRVRDADEAKAHADTLGVRLLAALPEDRPLAEDISAGNIANRTASGLTPIAQILCDLADANRNPKAE